jgi:hypothetical protein
VHVDPHYAPGQKLGGGAAEAASRSGKPAQAGRTGTGAEADERSAARRATPLPQGRGRVAQEQEGGRGLRPSEVREPGFGCPHVVMLLQKSVGDVWPQISSANALQKGRSGSSERGSSSERTSAGDTVGGRVGRNDESRVGLTAFAGEDRPKTLGGERSPSNGSHLAKSGARVAGPGL